MANKKNKRAGGKRRGYLGRSDIPYAQRLKMKQDNDIVNCRNHSAKIVMFCTSVALNELKGIGYKRLTNYSLYYKTVVDEFYEDIDVGMAHAKQRMDQIGMPISGEFYTAKQEGLSAWEQEIYDHSMQASQIAQICSTVSMNDFFGYGRDSLFTISERVTELSERYAREGEGFLLEAMAKIGFQIVDGCAIAYVDDDGKAVTPSRARKDGWEQ